MILVSGLDRMLALRVCSAEVKPGASEAVVAHALFHEQLMKRRTFRKIRSVSTSANHHHVYVVLLDPAVAQDRAIRAANPGRNPSKACLYVGLSGLEPEKRFRNHKQGIKAASIVKRYGIRLVPELYAHLNPMPYGAAAQMERDLADDLRSEGYTVAGGH
jgi:hypothetical protein